MKTATAPLPPLRSVKVLDQLRERIRYLHYSLRTEQAYVHWVRAFIRFHGVRHPATLGSSEVEAFLSWLANERKVSVSTHRQALAALLFFYGKVLCTDLPWLQEIGRPRPSRRLPVVLTPDEVVRILGFLEGEHRLFAERVSPEQDLIAARTAATEASIALRLAQQQVAAAGGGGGALNRIGIPSPIGGQVIARSVALGQTVAADAELFRVANLSQVALTLSLSPADAGRVRVGTPVEITAPGRRATARVSFVSPVLDETTRQVPVIALVDNRAGQWRVGEPVAAAVQLPGAIGTVTVPAAAVQTVENRTVVFVRTPTGFKATPVAVGQASGANVTVTSGLTGREEIAGTGSFTLKAELGKGEAEEEE